MTSYVSGMARPEPSSQNAAQRVAAAEAELKAARIALRDALYEDRNDGWSQTELADALGLSKQRVGQLTPGAPEQRRGRRKKSD